MFPAYLSEVVERGGDVRSFAETVIDEHVVEVDLHVKRVRVSVQPTDRIIQCHDHLALADDEQLT